MKRNHPNRHLATLVLPFALFVVSHSVEGQGFAWQHLFLPSVWPQVPFALDLLAWNWFFGLAMLFGGAGVQGWPTGETRAAPHARQR